MALGNRSNLEGACRDKLCPSSSRGDVDAISRNATISTIGFGTALVGLGVGVWGLLQDRPTSHDTASVRPWLGLGSAGIGGSF
jgi:hypothetical protein